MGRTQLVARSTAAYLKHQRLQLLPHLLPATPPTRVVSETSYKNESISSIDHSLVVFRIANVTRAQRDVNLYPTAGNLQGSCPDHPRLVALRRHSRKTPTRRTLRTGLKN